MDLNEVTQPDKVLKGLVRRFHSAGVGYRSLKCNGVSSFQVGDDACKYQISAEIEAADKMGVPQPYQIQDLFFDIILNLQSLFIGNAARYTAGFHNYISPFMGYIQYYSTNLPYGIYPTRVILINHIMFMGYIATCVREKHNDYKTSHH